MFLNDLNDMQLQAVKQTEGPVLILAGAGSGKTRVITYRIAHLIDQGVSENRILALTFTNKAAREMRERIDSLLDSENSIWVSTFHSFCVSILRKHIESIGYSSNFTIYDDNDSLAIIKECIKELNLDDLGVEVKTVKNTIASLKNDAIGVLEYEKSNRHDFDKLNTVRIYDLYEKKLKTNNALDFNDLLSKTLYLFKTNADVLDYYSDRFQYIHVDEYQDTNKTQYELVKLLASKHGNICVVGDDDQSIYGWRGANIRNILDFEKDFRNTTTIRLEQNYRSTSIILDAANSVIKNNMERKSKKLWTDKADGEKIRYYRAQDDRDEARYVVTEMQKLLKEGYSYKDFAVLYRTNTQSRIVEEIFLRAGIQYSVYGGFKFYSRKEIKDVISYLTVIVNPDDEVALRRIINTPKRGIGDTTIEKVVEYANQKGISLYDAIDKCEEIDIKPAAQKKIRAFVDKLNIAIAQGSFMQVTEFIETLVKDMGIIEQYEAKLTEENLTKKNNILEFISAAKEFESMGEEANLQDFLENIMLVTDMDNADENDNKVSLMTLHSAKGLEFPVVFMIGMEDNLFPSFMSLNERNKLEEERRLCYVGITRAKKILYMTNTYSRLQFGKISSNPPSMFIAEIPDTLLDRQSAYGKFEKKQTPSVSKVGGKQVSAFDAKPKQKLDKDADLTVGQKVYHNKFGEGMIMKVEGSGDNRLVSVAFEGAGIKKLSTAFAPLKLL